MTELMKEPVTSQSACLHTLLGLNAACSFAQPCNGPAVLSPRLGRRWGIALLTDVCDCTSAGRRRALVQLLRPFSVRPAISVSELEWALGLDSGLDTTYRCCSSASTLFGFLVLLVLSVDTKVPAALQKL